MIVSDTNLLAYLVIAGDHTPDADAVLARDPDWVAPPLWRSEFRNLLVLHGRQGLLSLDAAIAAFGKAESVLRREHPVDFESVLRLAERSSCSAYDCEFVHVAEQLGVPLVTSDQKLLRAFPQVAVSPESFAP